MTLEPRFKSPSPGLQDSPYCNCLCSVCPARPGSDGPERTSSVLKDGVDFQGQDAERAGPGGETTHLWLFGAQWTVLGSWRATAMSAGQ